MVKVYKMKKVDYKKYLREVTYRKDLGKKNILTEKEKVYKQGRY